MRPAIIRSILAVFLLICALVPFSCVKVRIIDIPKERIARIKSSENYLDLLTKVETIEVDLDYSLWPFYDVIIGSKYIVGIIATSEFRPYVWKRDGTFLGEIAEYGKGPGEYISGETGVFIEDDTFVLFDSYLLRASIFRFSDKGTDFIDLVDTTQWIHAGIDKAYFLNGRIYCFNSSGVKGAHRMLVFDKDFNLLIKKYPRKHISYAMFEQFDIIGDKIYMSDEIWHKSVNAVSKDPRHPENMGNILICDLEGNLIRRLRFDPSELIFHIIPDKDATTFYTGRKVIDANGKTIKEINRRIKITPETKWLENSLPATISRGNLIFADRSVKGKMIFRIFEYDV